MTTLYWLAYLTVYVCCLLEQGANYLDFSKTTVSVNGGVYTSLVDNLGNFSVQVPGPGSYKVEVHNLHTPPEGEEALKNKVKSQTERIAEIIAAKLNPTEAGTTTTA